MALFLYCFLLAVVDLKKRILMPQGPFTASDSGAVYVFQRNGATWAQEAYIKASNTEAGDRFGRWIGLSGDILAVQSRFEDSNATGVNGSQSNNSAANSGAVYVFRRSGTAWSQEAYVKASNTGAGDEFGYIVALSDDTLAIGAFLEDSNATGIGGNETNNSLLDSGAFYLFQ